MPVFTFEMRRGRNALLIWTASISFLLLVCVLMFPEMKGQMSAVSNIFANMRIFTQMFGMDKLDFGTLIGFYGIECGNILGIGGPMFAGLLGISALSKEEHDHTAEFLLTHPIKRSAVAGQKLLAMAVQILLLNFVCFTVSLLSILLVKEPLPLFELALLHLAFLILQMELGFICFGLSAFMRRNNAGVGLGLVMALYFVNLFRKIGKSAAFLRYVTPYAYADAADVLEKRALPLPMVLIGCALVLIALSLGILHYTRKDITA